MGSLNKKINFKKIAKEVIELEIKALQKLKKALNKNFDKAVDAIVNCQSKVILCGVGKSGIIASKISAIVINCTIFFYLLMIVHMQTWVVFQKKMF